MNYAMQQTYSAVNDYLAALDWDFVLSYEDVNVTCEDYDCIYTGTTLSVLIKTYNN